MEIKHAAFDPQSMSQDGDSILKSLQNNHLPIIDLIVRESIQNSLDAAITGTPSVIVNFHVGDFLTKDLSPQLEGVSTKLMTEYPGKHKFLAFGDKNTSGLDGVYDSEDPKLLKQSNFQKLIFDIGKKQEREGAGGSWGLGKTSYFRSGVGIVAYYTRIKKKDGFEERLVASLIESPKEANRLAPDNPRGIAWWGRLKENSDKLLPIIEGKDIENFLNIFNLERYTDNETGTMVIIPYFDPDKNLQQLDQKTVYFWENEIESKLKIAIQRWYMPRIVNQLYRKKMKQADLYPLVNGDLIMPGRNTEAVFEIFYNLYNSALSGEVTTLSNKNLTIFIEDIEYTRMITKKSRDLAGRVAYCEVSPEDLTMTPPENNPSPLAYIGQEDEEKNDNFNAKIMVFSRKPGMIVKYSVDEDWLPKMKIQDEKNYLFAFYVPKSDVELHPKLQELGYSDLESYLRDTETADHAEWTDIHSINIIKRTKKEITGLVQKSFETVSETRDGDSTSALARKFGNLFVPLNQGKRSTPIKTQPKNKTGMRRGSRGSLRVLENNIVSNDLLETKLEVSLPKGTEVVISLKLETQDRVITYKDWIKNIGTQDNFPVKILRAESSYDSININIHDNNELIVKSTNNEHLVIEISLQLNYLTLDYLPFFAIKSVSKGGREKNE